MPGPTSGDHQRAGTTCAVWLNFVFPDVFAGARADRPGFIIRREGVHGSMGYGTFETFKCFQMRSKTRQNGDSTVVAESTLNISVCLPILWV